MENLNEVGNKVRDSINNLKPSDIGDLTLGIYKIIEELRNNPEQHQEKLNHLEGLFGELVYGEPYELKEEINTTPNPISLSGLSPIIANPTINHTDLKWEDIRYYGDEEWGSWNPDGCRPYSDNTTNDNSHF